MATAPNASTPRDPRSAWLDAHAAPPGHKPQTLPFELVQELAVLALAADALVHGPDRHVGDWLGDLREAAGFGLSNRLMQVWAHASSAFWGAPAHRSETIEPSPDRKAGDFPPEAA